MHVSRVRSSDLRCLALLALVPDAVDAVNTQCVVGRWHVINMWGERLGALNSLHTAQLVSLKP